MTTPHPFRSDHGDRECDTPVADGRTCGASPNDPVHQWTATPLDELVDRLAARHGAVVRAQPGDTLVLLMPEDPDADTLHAVDGEGGSRPVEPSYTERLLHDLGAALPNVGLLAVIGVAGAVVVPPGSYVAEPDPVLPLTEPYPGEHNDGTRCANPEHQPDAPAYVHALLDALIATGQPIDFRGADVPADVQRRLAEAFEHSAPVVPGSITSPGGWCKPAADSTPSTGA